IIILYIVLQYCDNPIIKDMISMNTINFNDFFSKNKDKISQILPVSSAYYPAGDNLYYEDVSEKIMILTKGAARLLTVDPNGRSGIVEFFDENSVILSSLMRYSGNITYILSFTEPSTLMSFSPDDFVNIKSHTDIFGEFLSAVMAGISDSAVKLNIRTAITACRTTRSKLAEYFNYMRLSTNSVRFKIPISMSELADYIGADRAAMLREIKKMQDEGLLISKNRHITLLV
ncbi:MAG: Crp/Fnr family transcriptional regulator, partial [Firmicutes bacterium]|nr:Crp/Fnr family transcriptional regulator [Bacillota bacterium]